MKVASSVVLTGSAVSAICCAICTATFRMCGGRCSVRRVERFSHGHLPLCGGTARAVGAVQLLIERRTRDRIAIRPMMVLAWRVHGVKKRPLHNPQESRGSVKR